MRRRLVVGGFHVAAADWLGRVPGSRAAYGYGYGRPAGHGGGGDGARYGLSRPLASRHVYRQRQQPPRRLSVGDARGTLPLSQTVHTWLRTGPTCHCRTQATPQGVRAMSPSKRNHFFSYIKTPSV